MSDTPRTDAHIKGLLRDPEVSGCDRTLNLCRQLERELTAAQAKALKLQEENAKLQERVRRLETVMRDLVMELDAYLRPWNQPQKDPSNKAKRLDLAEDAARFEIKDHQ